MRPSQSSAEITPGQRPAEEGQETLAQRRAALLQAQLYQEGPDAATITNDGAAYEDDTVYGSTVDLQNDRCEDIRQDFREREPEPPRGMPARHRPDVHATSTPMDRRQLHPKTTEEVFMAMAESMTQILKQFTERDTKRRRWGTPRRDIPYQYSDLEHEDPEWFIEKMENYFEEVEIIEDLDRINIIGEQLRGTAKAWFDANLHIATRYKRFRNLFMERFNSPEEVARALAKLYGEKQPSYEAVAVFLARKRRMVDRLLPGQPTSITASILLNQIEPEVRSRLRGDKFETFEELIRVASQIEADVEEVRRTSHKSRTPAQAPPVNIAKREVLPLGNKAPPPPVVTESAPAKTTTTKTAYANTRPIPPTPCRFCGQWHYNSACPQNPYRSGNFTRAERKDTRGQPSAPPAPMRSNKDEVTRTRRTSE